MAEVQLKRPTIWLERGSSDPIIKSTFLNDTEIVAVHFYYASSATAADSAWTSLSTTAKPETVTDPFVSKTHTSAGFTTAYYYRARMTTAAAVGPWSNVIKSNEETFIYNVRDAWGLLRGIQFDADTENSASYPTWFEVMELVLQAHNHLREWLSKMFSDTDITLIWANPPAELVQYLEADVAYKVLSRATDLEEATRKERLRLARESRATAESAFLRDGTITLLNGDTKDFLSDRLRLS